MLLCEGDRVTVADLGLNPGEAGSMRSMRAGPTLLDSMTIEEAERFLIERAMSRHQGNVSRAAAALGLSRSALYRRLQRYGDWSPQATT